MDIYLVYKEVCYGNGRAYVAIFNNIKDAKKYVKNKNSKEELCIQICKNGEELF